MKEYLIEFDVPLWTYVLCYKQQKYPLATKNITRANELADIKIASLKRQENESNDKIKNVYN